MRFTTITIALAALTSSAFAASELGIEVTKAVKCTRTTKSGDNVQMQYKGMLENGNEFDSSYKRNAPFSFQLGAGRVIKGWDQGLLDMCIGEKRTLTIPPELGYGSRGMGPIPPSSTLIFETELVGIKGVDAAAVTVEEEKLEKELVPSSSAVAGGAQSGDQIDSLTIQKAAAQDDPIFQQMRDDGLV